VRRQSSQTRVLATASGTAKPISPVQLSCKAEEQAGIRDEPADRGDHHEHGQMRERREGCSPTAQPGERMLSRPWSQPGDKHEEHGHAHGQAGKPQPGPRRPLRAPGEKHERREQQQGDRQHRRGPCRCRAVRAQHAKAKGAVGDRRASGDGGYGREPAPPRPRRRQGRRQRDERQQHFPPERTRGPPGEAQVTEFVTQHGGDVQGDAEDGRLAQAGGRPSHPVHCR
jgi:hypothetical protein